TATRSPCRSPRGPPIRSLRPRPARASAYPTRAEAAGTSPPAPPRREPPRSECASRASCALSPKPGSSVLRRLHLLARPAEPPLPLPVPVDRGVERDRIEVGPQHVGEVQLGVGELPQQEVRDPLLPTGTDEQVGLGCVRHREEGLQLLRA